MNTLKLAMRSFAKATSHLFVEKTPSVIEFTSSETIKKIDDDSGIDEINGNLLDELFKTIGKYLQSVGLTDTSASASGSTSGGKNIKSFTTEEIQHFVQLLSKSADVPVTATILQVGIHLPILLHCPLHTHPSLLVSPSSHGFFVFVCVSFVSQIVIKI